MTSPIAQLVAAKTFSGAQPKLGVTKVDWSMPGMIATFHVAHLPHCVKLSCVLLEGIHPGKMPRTLSPAEYRDEGARTVHESSGRWAARLHNQVEYGSTEEQAIAKRRRRRLGA